MTEEEDLLGLDNNQTSELLADLEQANDYLDTGLVYAAHETVLELIRKVQEWASA